MCVLYFISEYANLIQVLSSVCTLLVTAIYVVYTRSQTKYIKQSFLESIKQTKEERQPYIVPCIGKVSGVAFGASTYMRIQFNFDYTLENVGDSSAVSICELLYAKWQYQAEERLVYAHLIPQYHHSIGVGKKVRESIHFETDEFREILEDIEISRVKNSKRIETAPSQRAYKGPLIILRVLYMNMMGQWFESVLEQELLDVCKKDQENGRKGERLTNQNIKKDEVFEGYMINPCYSLLRRRLVSVDDVNEILMDCYKNVETGYELPILC